jgi:hypothetical protein
MYYVYGMISIYYSINLDNFTTSKRGIILYYCIMIGTNKLELQTVAASVNLAAYSLPPTSWGVGLAAAESHGQHFPYYCF